MQLQDVPVQALVVSFLKAAAQVGFEATVVFTVGGTTAAASNRGQEGIANAATTLSIDTKEGIDTAAKALHEFRVRGEDGKVAPENDWCPLCRGNEKFDDLPDEGREAHRLVAKIVIGAAAVKTAEPKKKSLILGPV